MSDRILVERIAVFAHHGVHPEEEKLGQRFYVSVGCGLDLRPAGISDDFKKTVDYGRLTKIVLAIATTKRFRTIEALAEAIAADILATFGTVNEVTVMVEKPGAPVEAIIEGVTVEIHRQRDG